jgi:hypothetical protein
MTDPDSTEAMRQAAREVLREIVPGMLREALADPRANGNGHGHGNGNGHGHGHGHGNGHGNGNGNGQAGAPADRADARVRDETVPRVPAPPVAAVLRPSTWTGPAVPGEVIGDGAAAPAAGREPAVARGQDHPRDDPAGGDEPDVNVETVTIDTDADLDRFVRALIARLESPRERRAIRAGRVRFGLRRVAAARPGADSKAGSARTIRVTKGAVTERAVRDAAAEGARLVLARGAVLTPLARDQARALGVEIEKEARC